MVKALKIIVALTVAGLAASTANAQNLESATDRLNGYLDRFEDVVGPGFAVIVVTEDDILLNRVEGLRRASSGAPLTGDTPIYIASQTKAFMGLVAASLDERGILSLETTIDTWIPDAVWPGNMIAADYTLRDLLSHQVPFENGTITFLEAYVMRVDPADYPVLISEHSGARADGFEYDNLGYNVYAAILENATGRSWQDWMDEVLFDPLGMEHTSARTSDFGLDELAWSHIWQGEVDGWFEVHPKTDGMMQSAGGLVTSPNDMATWLQLQLRGEASGAELTSSMLDVAQISYVETGLENGRNAYEMACFGYSLGWNICEYQGYEVHIHGGGYTGARTVMAYLPEAGVGIAAFSNSDNMTGWWTQTAVRMFLQFLADDENADRMVDHRVDFYGSRTAMLLDRRQQHVASGNAESHWGGWTWRPEADELSAYAGIYGTEHLPVDAIISLDGDQLTMHLGDYQDRLLPAQPSLFGGQGTPLEPADRFDFQRDDNGHIISFTWNDETFIRE